MGLYALVLLTALTGAGLYVRSKGPAREITSESKDSFLSAVKNLPLPGYLSLPDDDEFLKDGEDACARFQKGQSVNDVKNYQNRISNLAAQISTAPDTAANRAILQKMKQWHFAQTDAADQYLCPASWNPIKILS